MWRGRALCYLTNGVVDEPPPIADARSAVERGLLRFCPVCDGYEVIDRNLAVVGHGSSGVKGSLFDLVAWISQWTQ
jgi:thioredoxin reductase (NADPH)